jgi:hypothetical protein
MTTALFWTAVGIGAAILIVRWWREAQADAREEARQKAQRAREKAEEEKRAESRREFMKAATLVRARVLSSFQVGRTNLQPDLQLSLRVESPDGPFDVDVEDNVEPTELHRLAAGSTIDVWFHPEHRERVYLELDQEFVRTIRESEEMLRHADKLLRGE